jgi:hypothetical protein
MSILFFLPFHPVFLTFRSCIAWFAQFFSLRELGVSLYFMTVDTFSMSVGNKVFCVKSFMLSGRCELQILYAIVGLDFVDMMNKLAIKEGTP